MSFDVSNMPVSGGIVLACVLYAGASFVAGQVIGERMIEKSGWPQQCERVVVAEIEAQRKPERYIPPTDCNSVIGILGTVVPELREICNAYGNPDLGGPGAEAARRAEALRRHREQERRQRALSEVTSRCECAVTLYTEDQRFPLAIYAGSGRLYTPLPVKNQTAELARSLVSPACQLMGGAGS